MKRYTLEQFYKEKLNKIYCCDCIAGMRAMPNECIDLVVTSPPYDNLRTYKGYSFDFKGIANELYRIIKVGGVIVWVVGDMTTKGNETGTSFKQALYFKEIGFNLFDTMIYQKANCPMRGSLFGYNQVFEYMFVLTKNKIKTTNLLFDRENSSTRITKHIAHRKVTGKIERAKEPFKTKKYGRRYNIWIYGNGRGVTSKDKIAFQHPAIFPEKLAEDHILSWSNKGDIVLDPMCGSGTTCKMAKINDRKFIGFDISQEYVNIANKRLAQLKEQKL